MTSDCIDRLTIRRRPGILPLMYQSWQKLLFMHWSLQPELLRPHVPQPLEIDTCDGRAWIAITPFVIRGLRPVFAPAMPGLSDFNEINVRTYVHYRGTPGVWFFSLDIDSLLSVIGARTTFLLPYYRAMMSFREQEGQIFYKSRRSKSWRIPAGFEASWQSGLLLGEPEPGSLEFFLVERYCLYSVWRGSVYQARIHHQPWSLRQASLMSFRSTMIEGQGLPLPEGQPLLHYSERQDVAIWPLKKLA